MAPCRWLFLFFTLLVLTTTVNASLIWRPGEGWSDEDGSEISASSSKEQLELAKKLEAKEDNKGAYQAYRGLVRRWPLSFSAPEAQFKIAQLEEKKGDFLRAFKSYQKMIEKYPNSKFFNQALDRQFAIGNLYLDGEPKRLWKVPLGPDYGQAVDIYQALIKNAPYGANAAQAMFHIGLAYERQKKYGEAVRAYHRLIDKYPGSSITDDAMYQIGYTWMKASREAEYDQSSAEKSLEAFQDFLVRFPHSDKVLAAEEHIEELTGKKTQGSLKIAQFYEKQGNKKAAFIYYNEVVRESPNSSYAEIAQAKIEELRETLEGKKAEEKSKKAAEALPESYQPSLKEAPTPAPAP